MIKRICKEFRETPLAFIFEILSISATVGVAIVLFIVGRPLTIAGLPVEVSVHRNDPEIYTWAVCDDNKHFVYGIEAPVFIKNYGRRPVELSHFNVGFSDEVWDSELVIDEEKVRPPIPLGNSEGPIKWYIKASKTYTEPTALIIDNVNARQGQQVQVTLYFNDESRAFTKLFSANFTDVLKSSCYAP